MGTARQCVRIQDKAIDLLLFLVGLDHTLALAEATQTTPARKTADASPHVQEPVPPPYCDALATAWSVPQHQRFEFVRRKGADRQTAALKQETGAREAVAEMIACTPVQLAGG